MRRHLGWLTTLAGLMLSGLLLIAANFKTDDFFLEDFTDNTKRLGFDLSNLATGVRASLIVPDPGAGASYAGTLALLESQQTFSAVNTFAAGYLVIKAPTIGTPFITFNKSGANSISLAAPTMTAVRQVNIPDQDGTLVTKENATTITGAYRFDADNGGAPEFRSTDPLNVPFFTIVDPTGGGDLTFIASGAITSVGGFLKFPAAGGSIVTSSTPVSGRIPFYSGTTGLVINDVDLSFATDKLTATKIDLANSVVVGGTLFTQTADKSVTNDTTQTSIFGTGVGSRTLAANFFTAGKTLKVHLEGTYSTAAITGGTLVVRVKYGSTTLATKSSTSLLIGAAANYWKGDLYITCRTTGSSGTVMTSGNMNYQIAGSSTVTDELNNAAATTTINTTTSATFDVTVAWAAASASDIAKSIVGTVEAVN